MSEFYFGENCTFETLEKICSYKRLFLLDFLQDTRINKDNKKQKEKLVEKDEEHEILP